MKAEIYRAALKGSMEVMNFTSWHEQLTPRGNTVLHVHVDTPTHEGKVNVEFINKVLHLATGYSLLWHQNANKETTLHLAARFGHTEAVAELLKQVRRNEGEVQMSRILRMTNKRGDTPLHEAARGGHVRVAELLVEADPNTPHEPNDGGETPLYLAAESGSTALVAIILDMIYSFSLTAGTTYGYRGPCGRTALHAAVQWGMPEMVQKLLEKDGSLIRVQDDKGQTALHCAAAETESQNLHVLLSYDNEFNDTESATYIQDNEGRTALHIAALLGDWSNIKVLISSYPDCIDIVDRKGWNVVHFAANRGCITEFKYFLELGQFGKLINEKDLDGNTPLHVLANCFPCITGPCLREVPFLPDDPRFDLKAFNNLNFTVGDIVASQTLPDRTVMRNSKKRVVSKVKGRRITHERNFSTERGVSGNEAEKHTTNLMNAAQSRLVVATLIATVSFAAGFTVPGGFNQDSDPNPAGIAILIKNTAFKAFLVTDSLAFICSSIAVMLYFRLPSFKSIVAIDQVSRMAFVFNIVALVAMVLAFATGVYAVVSLSHVLTAMILCISALFFFFYGYYFLLENTGVVTVYMNRCNINDSLLPQRPVVDRIMTPMGWTGWK